MATEVGNLVANLELKSAQFVSELRKTNKRLGRMESGFQRVGRVGVAAFKSIAVAAGGVALAALGRDAVQTADKIGKLSDRLNISTEALSELQFVGERGGVAFNTMTLALQRLERRSAEAAVGVGEARGAIAELGIDAQRFGRLSLDNQFEIVSEALSKVQNESDRTRLAFKLFDSEGVALVQTMGEGAAGIQALREEAQRLGATLSQEDAAAAAQAADAVTNLSSAFDALARQLAINIAPALTELANFLANAIPKALEAAARVIRKFGAAVTKLFAKIIDTIAFDFRKLAEAADFIGFDDTAAGLRGFADRLSGVSGALKFYSLLADSAAESTEKLRISYKKISQERATLQDVSLGNKQQGGFNFVENSLKLNGGKAAEAVSEGLENADLSGLSFAVESALVSGAESGAKGMVSSILQEIQRSLLSKLAGGIANAIGGTSGGGFLGGLLGFRTGGSFTVGGSGGPDSKFVGFRATPGEKVTVSRPGQGAGGIGGLVINQNLNVSGTTRAEQVAFAAAIREQTKADVMDTLQRSGRLR